MSKTFPSKYFPFSKFTFFLGLFIIISASFMKQAMNFVKANIGENGFKIIISSILAVSGLVFLIFIIRDVLRRQQACLLPTLIIIVIMVIGLFLVGQIKIPEERIHLLEFAALGWFALRDTLRVYKKVKGISFALAFALVIGVLDEAFQAILPYRYFQSWDILLNSLGGIWGIILYLIYA